MSRSNSYVPNYRVYTTSYNLFTLLEIQLEGYDIFRGDRQICKRGGGVLLYVKAELNASNFIPRTKFPEQVSCKIVNNCGAELLIGACYRSDNKKAISGWKSCSIKESDR